MAKTRKAQEVKTKGDAQAYLAWFLAVKDAEDGDLERLISCCASTSARRRKRM